jgi:hypothetical protein
VAPPQYNPDNPTRTERNDDAHSKYLSKRRFQEYQLICQPGEGAYVQQNNGQNKGKPPTTEIAGPAGEGPVGRRGKVQRLVLMYFLYQGLVLMATQESISANGGSFRAVFGASSP